jgi:hypothetical protein
MAIKNLLINTIFINILLRKKSFYSCDVQNRWSRIVIKRRNCLSVLAYLGLKILTDSCWSVLNYCQYKDIFMWFFLPQQRIHPTFKGHEHRKLYVRIKKSEIVSHLELLRLCSLIKAFSINQIQHFRRHFAVLVVLVYLITSISKRVFDVKMVKSILK